MSSVTIPFYGFDVRIQVMEENGIVMALPPEGKPLKPLTLMLSTKQLQDSRGNTRKRTQYMNELTVKVRDKMRREWKPEFLL